MKRSYKNYNQIFPHLIGEILIWGTEHHEATYLQPLMRTHKRIIRLLLNLPPRAHTKPLMRKLKILNLSNLYIHPAHLHVHAPIHPRKTRMQPTNAQQPPHNGITNP